MSLKLRALLTVFHRRNEELVNKSEYRIKLLVIGFGDESCSRVLFPQFPCSLDKRAYKTVNRRNDSRVCMSELTTGEILDRLL